MHLETVSIELDFVAHAAPDGAVSPKVASDAPMKDGKGAGRRLSRPAAIRRASKFFTYCR